MIEVTICLKDGNKIKGFSISGHAYFAEYGSDIVCSAVSAVAQTAVLGLQHYFGEAVEVQKKEGSLICALSQLKPSEENTAETILKTMYWGLKAIQAQYGKYVHLTVEGGALE